MSMFTIAINLIKRSIGTVRGFVSFILIPTIAVSLSILSFGGNSQDTMHRVHYVNEDSGHFGSLMIKRLSSHADYSLFPMAHSDLIREKVFTLRTNETFIIPADFTERLMNGQRAELVQVLMNMEAKNTALSWMLNEQIDTMADMVEHLKAQGIHSEVEITQAIEQLWAKHELYPVPGEISKEKLWQRPKENQIGEVNRIMLLFIMGIISQAIIVVVNDQKQQTLYRMYMTPIRSMDIVAGNFLGSFLMGTLQIILMLGITRYIMDFNYGGSPFALQFLVLELFLLASLGIACIVGALSKESDHIGLINILVVIPTSMIGGCFWSIDDMPGFMQKLANFVPQSWAIDAIETLEDGGGLYDISLNLAILLAIALVLLLFGSKVLRPKDS